jgi:hypothetical protein
VSLEKVSLKRGICDNPACLRHVMAADEFSEVIGLDLQIGYVYQNGGTRGRLWVCSAPCATPAIEAWQENPERGKS